MTMTTTDWQSFTLDAADPATPNALRAYALKAEQLGYDADYVLYIRRIAEQFEEYRAVAGAKIPTLKDG